MTDPDTLAAAWHTEAERWIAWARYRAADDEWSDSYWRFHRERLFAVLPEPGRRTLDAGCGEGRVSRDLVAAGHDVIALDRSPTMAAAAHTHEQSIRTVAASATAMPFGPATFDLVVSFMVLQDVDEPDLAIGEAARVLEPHGRLVITVVHPMNSGGTFEPAGDHDAPFVLRDSYFERRRIVDTFERAGMPMTFHSEHRPLRFYTSLLREHGLVVEHLDEVEDPAVGDRWNRMPLFLHLIARRLT